MSEPTKFAAFIEVSGTEVTPRQIMEAVNHGLAALFYYDKNLPSFDVTVHKILRGNDEWQPGHMNLLTAVHQRKNDG